MHLRAEVPRLLAEKRPDSKGDPAALRGLDPTHGNARGKSTRVDDSYFTGGCAAVEAVGLCV